MKFVSFIKFYVVTTMDLHYKTFTFIMVRELYGPKRLGSKYMVILLVVHRI